jgi:serine/threonine protein kinase/tetratricopeptide (TPR) repeat protein
MIGTRISHYRILSELGRGGMGIVYKAQDERLPRCVALKVLRSEFVSSHDSRDRFLREARTAVAVVHPYIATVFDAGEQDNTLFIAMEYVEGLTLRALLNRGALPTRDALNHAAEIAEGLAQAHHAQVIHRDLKPENVMISKVGHAKILDFGLAKLIEKRDEVTSSLLEDMTTLPTQLTERDTRVGTPAYMSPEQVRAQHVDHRSDLFSFGSLLFEMCTRRPLFIRDNQADTLAAILRDGVPSVTEYNPEAPERLDWILEKCLAKDPRDRYQDTRDLFVDLDHLRSQVISEGIHPTPEGSGSGNHITAPVSGAGRIRESIPPSRTPSPGPRRFPGAQRILLLVVVLAVCGYFAWKYWPRADSVPEPGPEPIANSAVFHQRGLHYLREESEGPRSLGTAIQMFNRAIAEDSTSAVAWAALSESYSARFHHTRSPADFAESEKALSRALALDPDLPEVLNAEGRKLLMEKKQQEALVVLQRAVEMDPKMDAAWANIGRAHRDLGNYAEGLEAIRTAIRINPQSFRHRISLGNFYEKWSEYKEAGAAYREALNLKPNSTIAWNNLGSTHLRRGEPEEAAQAFQRALAEDDAYGSAWSNLGVAYYFMQDFDAAAKSYRRAVELEPHKVSNYTNLAEALVELGRDEECRQVYAKASQLARQEAEEKPQDPAARLRLGVLCARAGDVDCALDASRMAEEMEPANPQILFRSAIVHAILDQTQAALDRLESAVRLGLKRAEIENDPDLRHLHGQPRYSRIVELAG